MPKTTPKRARRRALAEHVHAGSSDRAWPGKSASQSSARASGLSSRENGRSRPPGRHCASQRAMRLGASGRTGATGRATVDFVAQ